jgi:hypothetical protein
MIPEDVYKHHTALSESGQSLYSDNTWRGFACRATRRELIEQAWSISAINPVNYIDVFRNEKTVTIGHIVVEFENKEIKSVVYYFPDRGIYAAACGNNRVYDVWLSWPCYPQGW